MKRNLIWWGCLMVLIGVLLLPTGCKTKNLFRLTTRQEIEIGNETARELERQHGLVEGGRDLSRIRNMGQRLVRYCERPDLPYRFNILDTDDVNALAVPGGPVYVTRGLLQQVRPDDGELAGVMGHEIAHVARRHAVKMIEKSSQISILVALLTHKSDEGVQAVTQLAQNLYLQDYSRQEEAEADWYGIAYAYQAGYDPYGLKRFFEELHRLQGGQEPRGLAVYLSSHPQTTKRIKRAEKRALELEQGG